MTSGGSLNRMCRHEGLVLIWLLVAAWVSSGCEAFSTTTQRVTTTSRSQTTGKITTRRITLHAKFDSQKDFYKANLLEEEEEEDTRPSKWDPSPLQRETPPLATTIVTSLQVVTVAVSLVFCATLFFSQGRLVAPAPPRSTAPPIDAEELLQQDWQRLSDDDVRVEAQER